MFATLRRKMATFNLILNPLILVLDFESGILPSLRQHFPNSSIKGCNFHCTQAVWRKVQFSSSLQDKHLKKNNQIVDGTPIHSSDVDKTDFYSNHHDGHRATTSCYRTVRILLQHLAKWTAPVRHVERVQTGHSY
jgi:hypothetical protein